MKNTIYELRYQELDPALATKLWPFILSYRPHDKPYNWRELREDGLERVEEESLMDVITDQYESEKEMAEAAAGP